MFFFCPATTTTTRLTSSVTSGGFRRIYLTKAEACSLHMVPTGRDRSSYTATIDLQVVLVQYSSGGGTVPVLYQVKAKITGVADTTQSDHLGTVNSTKLKDCSLYNS